MTYTPLTESERFSMLATIGVPDIEALFSDVPPALRAPAIDLPASLSELELRNALTALAASNVGAGLTCFAGFGSYDHFIPCAVDALATRSEFVTSYTPYQAEISQGNLQATYEYQTMIAGLCGCEIANASLYDGATGLFEAVMMAVRVSKRRRRVVLDDALHPHALEVVRTLSAHLDVERVCVPYREGQSDLAALAESIDDDTAAVVTASPNVFGAVTDLCGLADAAHAKGALLVCATHPLSLGALQPPGAMGADIVCGEGQPLGLPMSYGGPYLGFLACRSQYARSIPGRLVGATVDSRNRRAFCLALQTREQHIRREKATSNICTNQALCALRAAVYLALMGESGIRAVSERCISLSHYARETLRTTPGVSVRWEYPCFNEFVVHTERPAVDVLNALCERGVLGGIDLFSVGHGDGHALLIAVTEKRSTGEIDQLAGALAAAHTS
ncbi:MAG: aminomethyl-transferring glycine dehydrogenase subunit GcvPA [Verrucomicrobia bacterium]|nr:aminomethyl-transferring glycine dehydrogenase subunit GcvPA [Verrucomicrobiota bacterium]MDA1086396.1 aminomethyl-transferring glycine dehydrogenase subunit GcvPA [Verrucomicrobiota bacterium]